MSTRAATERATGHGRDRGLRKDASTWDAASAELGDAAMAAARLQLGALHFSYLGDQLDLTEVPDPALMRRAGKRTILILILVLLFLTPITAWGVALLAAGEPPGLPLAVGGAVAGDGGRHAHGVRRPRSPNLGQDTVSRSSLRTARRLTAGAGIACLVTLLTLALYGLVRGLSGEWWSLVTALAVGIPLFFLARGARNVTTAQDRSPARA